jgi:hypothetical protein
VRSFRPVDVVALVLAIGLGVGIFLIGLALVINVLEGHNPTPTLGTNTTQVLIAVMGGLIGVLGSYLGYSLALSSGHQHATTPPADWPTQTK